MFILKFFKKKFFLLPSENKIFFFIHIFHRYVCMLAFLGDWEINGCSEIRSYISIQQYKLLPHLLPGLLQLSSTWS